MHLGAALLACAGLAQLTGGKAATEIHLPCMAIAPDLDVEFLRESVDATDSDAVEAARDFVGGGIKLAAGVKLGENDLDGGHHFAIADGHHVDWNATAVVDHSDGVVDVNDDFNFFSVASEGLVDGVVDYFVNKMMKAHVAGRTDVHGRAEAYGLEAFKDLNVFAGVMAVVLRKRAFVGDFSRHRFPFADSSPWTQDHAGGRSLTPDGLIQGLTA